MAALYYDPSERQAFTSTFVVVAWVSLACRGQQDSRSLLLTSSVTLWGLRLAGYLGCRNIGKPEDYRYAAMRDRHGKRFPVVSLFTVFGLQGAPSLARASADPNRTNVEGELAVPQGRSRMTAGLPMWPRRILRRQASQSRIRHSG